MKTSNSLIIAYLLIMFGGTFLLYVTSSIHGPEIKYLKDVDVNHDGNPHIEKELEPFSVVVADYGVNFSLEHADKCAVYFYRLKGKEIVIPDYKIKNDTLFLDSSTIVEGVKPRFFSRKIRAIKGLGKNTIRFDKILTENMNIDINGGHIMGSFDPSIILDLNVVAMESRIEIYHSRINFLTLDIKNTKFNADQADIEKIEGELFYNSKLEIKENTVMSLNCDKSSSFSMIK